MFDEYHQQLMQERMEFIINTHWEEVPKVDLREVEVFGSQPVDMIIFTNPAGYMDEMD
jgi:hypothetical protein